MLNYCCMWLLLAIHPFVPKIKIWPVFRLQLNHSQLFIAHAKIVALNLKQLPEVGKIWKPLLRLPAHTWVNHIDLASRNSLLQVVWGTLAFSKCCFNELPGFDDGDSEIIRRVRNCQATSWTKTKDTTRRILCPRLVVTSVCCHQFSGSAKCVL